MNNNSIIRVELDIIAQKMIQQYMLNNEMISKEIEDGIKNAFEKVDIKKELEMSLETSIKDSIKNIFQYGKIKQMINNRLESLLDEKMEKLMDEIIVKDAKTR